MSTGICRGRLEEDWIWIQLPGGNVLRAMAEAERVAAKLRETSAASSVTLSPPPPR
jgi:hypothetical protein